jgi:hypothetical protein
VYPQEFPEFGPRGGGGGTGAGHRDRGGRVSPQRGVHGGESAGEGGQERPGMSVACTCRVNDMHFRRRHANHLRRTRQARAAARRARMARKDAARGAGADDDAAVHAGKQEARGSFGVGSFRIAGAGGEQGGLAGADADPVAAGQDRGEHLGRDVRGERAGIQEQQRSRRERRGPARDGRGGRAEDAVPGDVHGVVRGHLQGGEIVKGLGAEAGDERALPRRAGRRGRPCRHGRPGRHGKPGQCGRPGLGTGFDENDRKASVAERIRGAEDPDALGRQGRADHVAPWAGAVAARVPHLHALPGGGGHHVESAAHCHRRGRREHVAAAVRQSGHAHDNVDDRLAGEDEAHGGGDRGRVIHQGPFGIIGL